MYDPKVSVIWDIIRDFFEAQGCPIDVVVLQQLRAAGRGAARPARSTSPGTRRWPGSTRSADPAAPAAPSRCATPTAIACRTSSRAATDPVQTLADLRGRTLAVGAIDSPQATLIPLGRLRRDGLDPAARPHGPALRRAGRQARRPRRRRARRVRVPAARRGGGLRDARSELGRLDAGRHDRRRPVHDRRRDRPLRPLRLHRPRRISMPPRSGAGSTRCSRCATTIRRTAR